MKVTCEQELGGKWIVRINGRWVMGYWRELPARRLTQKLMEILHET